MKRKVAAVSALAALLLVQLTVVNGVALPGGGTPDLVLLCVVALGLTPRAARQPACRAVRARAVPGRLRLGPATVHAAALRRGGHRGRGGDGRARRGAGGGHHAHPGHARGDVGDGGPGAARVGALRPRTRPVRAALLGQGGRRTGRELRSARRLARDGDRRQRRAADGAQRSRRPWPPQAAAGGAAAGDRRRQPRRGQRAMAGRRHSRGRARGGSDRLAGRPGPVPPCPPRAGQADRHGDRREPAQGSILGRQAPAGAGAGDAPGAGQAGQARPAAARLRRSRDRGDAA